MIVVFDTNVWKSELFLQSPAAAAARFFLRERRARVGLPEVVRMEVEQHLRREIKAKIDLLRGEHNRLLRLFGQLRELALPTDEDIEAVVGRVFAELGVEVLKVPFTPESARSSFLKVIQKVPPSHKTQEFKDGVLWADCLKLLETDDVCLVSNDHAFYEGDNVTNGLAATLQAEVANVTNAFYITPKLSNLLEQIRSDYDISGDDISKHVLQAAGDRFLAQLAAKDFSLGELVEAKKKLFATEVPRFVFVEFELTYRCPDITGTRDDAILTIKGDGSYDAEGQRFLDNHRTFSETISFRERDGADQELRNAFVYAEGLTLGHREIRNTIRYVISE